MNVMLIQHVGVCAVLAAVVGISCRVGRLRPALCHGLWLVLLVKLITPPVAIYPWSPRHVLETCVRLIAANPNPTVEPAVRKGALRSPETLVARLSGTLTREIRGSAAAGRFTWRGNALAVVLVALWGAGSLGFAVIQGMRLYRLRRRLRSKAPIPPGLAAQVRELAEYFGMTPPEPAAVADIPSAMAWGFWRSQLLFPSDALERTGAAHWRGIVAHELAHLKRRDHWVGLLELLAGCIWWWNPVFWYVRRKLHEQAELACDAWVVWAAPDGRRDYAEALVSVVETMSKQRAPAPALGLGCGPAMAFERRLVMVLHGNVPRRLSLGGAALVALLAMLVLPGWAQETTATSTPPAVEAAGAPPSKTLPDSSQAPPYAMHISLPDTQSSGKQAAPQTGLEKALDSPVNLEFEDVHILDIVEFMADAWNVNIAIDWRVVLPPQPKEAPPAEVPASPGYSAEAPTEVPAAAKAVEAAIVPDSLDAAPGSNGEYVTDGHVRYVSLKDVSMREALTAILRPLNVTFEVKRSAIWISSPERIAADAKRSRPAGPASGNESLMQILDSPISIEFTNIHVSEITEFMSDSWNVNIVLDSRVIAPIKGSINDRELGSPGYVTDGIVPYVKLVDIAMADALDVLLRSLNLTYMPEGNFVWVSSYDLIEKTGASSIDPATAGIRRGVEQ